MKTKASDFTILWDNAYAVHHISEKPDRLANILEACRKAGHPDRVYIFSSTSKLSFPGAETGDGTVCPVCATGQS